MLSNESKQQLFSRFALELQGWTTNTLPTLDAVREIAQLASALPSIEIKNEGTFVAACKKWLRVRQCEQFYKKEKDGIAEFLAENLCVEDWQTEVSAALQHLVEHFHLFGGKSRGEFLVWVARRLRRLPAMKNHATLRDYVAMGIDDFDDAKPDLSDFKFTEHSMPFGTEYHIPLEGGHVWRVRDLKQAKGLWPVRVTKVNGTPYIVKVVRGRTIFVHRLFFNLNIGDVVRAFDDDYTNFSLYPFSRHVEVFWGDWKNPEKTHKSKLIRAEGTKPIYTELRQQWVPNLHVAHDTQVNASAQDRQGEFEEKMLQSLEVDNGDGETQTVDFGGVASGYANPVATADVVRPTLGGKNSAANRGALDKKDYREAQAIRKEMTVARIRDINREADHAQDDDVAGEERTSVPLTDRPSLVEDVAALVAEMERAENA
jgi:hypothetical protein